MDPGQIARAAASTAAGGLVGIYSSIPSRPQLLHVLFADVVPLQLPYIGGPAGRSLPRLKIIREYAGVG